MKNSKTVDDYFSQQEQWQVELRLLREIFLQTKMEESLKWGIPSYAHQGKNIAGMAAFKSYVGIWFHQGVFLKDEQQKLVSASEKTNALRQWRFHSLSEISSNKELILHYLEESILNQTLGKEIKPKRNPPFEMPVELGERLEKDKALKSSFDILSNAKKRDFALYIAEAKKAETKESRLEKIIPLIHRGLGLYDKYK